MDREKVWSQQLQLDFSDYKINIERKSIQKDSERNPELGNLLLLLDFRDYFWVISELSSDFLVIIRWTGEFFYGNFFLIGEI